MLGDLRDLYQEVILEHGKHPRNRRQLKDANRNAFGHNPMCGDALVVHLLVDDEHRIRDVAFEGEGCAISVASASLMTETLKGKTEDEAKALFDSFHEMCTKDEAPDTPDVDPEALERLQVLSGVRAFPVRVKCATLAWHTMAAALKGQKEVSTE
jgi:nitrogen fixation NifU-like protein